MRISFIIPDREMPWDSIHQGIGYVAAYAEKHFPLEECRIFRTFGTNNNELEEFLGGNWDVIGLTVTSPVIEESAHITERIKSLCPAKIVVGGSEATTLEEKIFEKIPLMDYAVVGEGEITFYELLECLKKNSDPSGIKGLIYRNENGQIIKNPARGFDRKIERFPYPDRRLFTYQYKFHSLIGTRGCPYHCTFCNSSSNWGHVYRVRSPESISKEVEYVINLYGRRKTFAFNDDSFNIKKDWVVEVCNKLEPLGISWRIRGLRAGLITDKIADHLLSSGCFAVACGVESANNNALKSMRKGDTIEHIMRGVAILKSRGIKVLGQFIIGNQADTLDTVKESIECARHFTDATFGIAYPIPHTFLYDYVVKNNCMLSKPTPVKFRGRIIDWVLFDTPHFPVEERLIAVDLAVKARMYHNIDHNKSLKIVSKIYNELTYLLKRKRLRLGM